jgi:enoyl-CoA hydratase/carnithine racemase
MAKPCLLVEKSDGIATLTLHRPDRLNAYTPEMGDALCQAFRALRDDDEVRVVILTGAGRAFCSGVDLEVLQSASDEERAKMGAADFIRVLPAELVEYPKPTIAAINGAAIGVGLTMVLPLDVRIAAADAKLGLTFAKLGILPGLGSTHLLPRLVGPARARELVLSARVLRGEEACRIGLVQESLPAEDVLPAARTLASQMAAHDPQVLAHAKRALAFGERADLAAALENEARASASLAEAKKRR